MATTPAQQAHYQRNRDRYIAQAKDQRREQQEYIRAVKSVPCMDCGIKYPYYVMQLDHVRGDKIKAVASMMGRTSLRLIQEEVAKCDVVCANCHAVRTYNRTSRAGV